MKNLQLLSLLFVSISVFGQTSATIQPQNTTIVASSNGSLFSVTNSYSMVGASHGINSSTNSQHGGAGVAGYSFATAPVGHTYGIYGLNASLNNFGFGIYGRHEGNGIGVYGYAASGTGVYGNSANTGVYGDGNYLGIHGWSAGGTAGYFNTASGYSLITDGGNVGIGIQTPNELLDVNGRMRIRDNGAGSAGIWMSNSSNGLTNSDGAFFGIDNPMPSIETAGIWIGGAWQFYVNRLGNGFFTGLVCASNISCVSDERYKKNITPLTCSLANVLRINGVRYEWRKEEFPEKNFSDKNQIGFIAQEIEKIYPEMVFTDEKGYKSVDYARLTPVLVEALKELSLKNDELERRLNKIEASLHSTETLNSKR